MKIAFLSCIHGNFEALQVVVKDLESQGAEKVYCLGDIVGYGAEPRECVELIRERDWPTIMGNHDASLVNFMDMDDYGVRDHCQKSILYASGALGKDHRDWIRSLPDMLVEDEFQMVHASPAGEKRWLEYVVTPETAEAAFEAAQRKWVILGHTHLPVAIYKESKGVRSQKESPWTLEPQGPVLLNCGSVGQPRDKDPRSGYLILDTDTREAQVRRLEYDVDAAADKIKEAGLFENFGKRLKIGI